MACWYFRVTENREYQQKFSLFIEGMTPEIAATGVTIHSIRELEHAEPLSEQRQDSWKEPDKYE